MGKIKLRGPVENAYPEPQPVVDKGYPDLDLHVERIPRLRMAEFPAFEIRQEEIRPMAEPVGLAYSMRMVYNRDPEVINTREERLPAQFSDDVMGAFERDVEAFYGTRIENNSSNGLQPRMHVSGVTFLNEGSGVTVEDVI